MIKKFDSNFIILVICALFCVTLCQPARSAEIKTQTFERGIYRVTKYTEGRSVKKITYVKKAAPYSFTGTQIQGVLSRAGTKWNKIPSLSGSWISAEGYTAALYSTILVIDFTRQPTTQKQLTAQNQQPTKTIKLNQPASPSISTQLEKILTDSQRTSQRAEKSAEQGAKALAIIIFGWLIASFIIFALATTLIIFLIKYLHSHNKRADKLTEAAEIIAHSAADRIRADTPKQTPEENHDRYKPKQEIHDDSRYMPKN